MEVEVQHLVVVAVVVMGRGYFDHVSVTSLLMPPSGRCSTTSPWGRVRWWFKRRRAIISSVLLVLLLLPHSCSNRSVHRHSMATSRASFDVIIFANKLIMTQFRDFFYDGMKRRTIEDDILLLHWWSSEMCCDYSSIFSMQLLNVLLCPQYFFDGVLVLLSVVTSGERSGLSRICLT